MQRTTRPRHALARVLTVALILPGVYGCGSSARSQTITVFAASSLTDAFTQIGRDFEAAHPGVAVAFNFGGSQNLRTQLEQGAVADVFASANPNEMNAIVAAGLVDPQSVRPFLTNELVVILPSDNPGRLETLADLARPGVRLVLAAEGVPAGDYSRAVLAKLEPTLGPGFAERVLANLVSSENNTRQVVAKVELNEADAGIAYVSDAIAAPGVKSIAIPAEYNVTAVYPIAPLKASPRPDFARAFVDYVRSPSGQAALAQWGFRPLATDAPPSP